MDVLSTLRRNNPQLDLPEPRNSFEVLTRRGKCCPSDTLDHITLHRLATQSKLPARSLGFTYLPALTPTMPAVKLRVVATSTIRADTTNAKHGRSQQQHIHGWCFEPRSFGHRHRQYKLQWRSRCGWFGTWAYITRFFV